jgi:hypothetical protein
MRFAGALAYEPRPADAKAPMVAAGVGRPPFRTSALGWSNANTPGSSIAACANTGVAITDKKAAAPKV